MNTLLLATFKVAFTTSVLAATLLFAAPTVVAAVPDGINYQAYLTDDEGAPIDSTVTIAFAIYNVDLGGIPLWNDTLSVNVDQGLFSVTLGNPVNPFPAGLFDGPVYLGMFVAGEEMMPRRPFSSNAFSFKSKDADTVDGQDAASLDQSSDVSDLQTGLSNVSSDVSAVQNATASNESRIDTLEATSGDITGVSAGGGLTGGGAAGNVAIAVASGGIDNTMLANGSVTALKLATGSVTGTAVNDGTITSLDIAEGGVSPVNMNPFGDYELSGLTVGSQGFAIDSQFDIEIFDDFNGLRWFSSDGENQFAAIVVRDSDITFTDVSQGRAIIRSTTNGVSIATNTTSAGYDVTVPSLSVLGGVGMGYERVSATLNIDTEIPQCHSHGNLPCFYGNANVSCPVGKKVLGGGVDGVLPRYGSVGSSYAISETQWSCGVSYDLAAVRTCYAICARMD